MVQQRTWILLGCGIAMALGLIVIAKWRMPQRITMSGDATILDQGLFAYRPRYIVSFPQIKVAPDAQYLFHVRGLPRTSMTFHLAPVASSPLFMPEEDWTLTVHIRDEGQKDVYEVSAPLTDWKVEQPSMYIWHPSLRDLSFKKHHTYSFDIEFSGPESDDTDALLMPQLTGGGYELP